MKKIFITTIFLVLLGCTSNKPKFGVNYVSETYNRTSQYIISFYENDSLPDDNIFLIIDSTQILPKNLIKTEYIKKHIQIDHEKYIFFKGEIQRINCQVQEEKEGKLFIEIDIREKGYLSERYHLNSTLQINEYIELSKKLFGDQNHVPNNFLK